MYCKLATVAYKCISSRAADYLASMFTGVKSVEAHARLHSATASRVADSYCRRLTQLELADLVFTMLAQLPFATTSDRHFNSVIHRQSNGRGHITNAIVTVTVTEIEKKGII